MSLAPLLDRTYCSICRAEHGALCHVVLFMRECDMFYYVLIVLDVLTGP